MSENIANEVIQGECAKDTEEGYKPAHTLGPAIVSPQQERPVPDGLRRDGASLSADARAGHPDGRALCLALAAERDGHRH
eukprot:scaffold133906_cov49-Tisochrysis_lutea.AAC.2